MIGFYDYTVIATYLATIFGVTGICRAADGGVLAAVFCLLMAGLLDTFDGRIARTKKNRTASEKRFGVQIDSLNDMICFGVLPAVIGYRTGGTTALWFIATLCFFVLAGLIRLAYFNVQEEERTDGSARVYYLGFPITSATLVIPLLYLLSQVFPAASPVIFGLGMFITGILFLAPVQIRKAQLKAIIVFAIIGAAELAGLIYIAVVQRTVMPL